MVYRIKEIGEAIGSIGVVAVNEKVQSMEVGYCLSCDYWNKGIMSEALEAVAEYLTNEVGARRMRRDVIPEIRTQPK